MDDLATELALLSSARRSLASDPGATLEALDRHRDRFPESEHAQSREALAVDALLRLGRRDEAHARAEVFFRRWPGSPLGHRIARSLTRESESE